MFKAKLTLDALEAREVPAFVLNLKGAVVAARPAASPPPTPQVVNGILFPVFDAGIAAKPPAGLTATVAAPGPLAGILFPVFAPRR